MSKRKYTPEDKKIVRRLLLLHGGEVGVVHQLTGIPRRTLYDWRAEWDDDYELYLDAFAQKILARANAKEGVQHPSNPDVARDSASAQALDPFAQFTQLREILMGHVMTLARNLMFDDSAVNQRAQALSRLIDRILLLDDILPSKNPEKTIRLEYYYDGAVQEHPPWHGASTGEGPIRSVENYLPESHPNYKPPKPIPRRDDLE